VQPRDLQLRHKDVLVVTRVAYQSRLLIVAGKIEFLGLLRLSSQKQVGIGSVVEMGRRIVAEPVDGIEVEARRPEVA
jgi:hypothetical protein